MNFMRCFKDPDFYEKNDIDFTDSMFVMTSNCGLKDLKTELLGFGNTPSSESHKEEILKSLELLTSCPLVNSAQLITQKLGENFSPNFLAS